MKCFHQTLVLLPRLLLLVFLLFTVVGAASIVAFLAICIVSNAAFVVSSTAD